MRIITKALLGLAIVGALMVPAISNAQGRGIEFKLNGTRYQSNPDAMSGQGGCNSHLIDDRTGQRVCPLDTVESPESYWRRMIYLRSCPLKQYGESACIGGFVAVAPSDDINCPQTPGRCTYYRIVRPYDRLESYDVNVGFISQKGHYLWIARETDPYWSLFGRCYNSQFTNRRGSC